MSPKKDTDSPTTSSSSAEGVGKGDDNGGFGSGVSPDAGRRRRQFSPFAEFAAGEESPKRELEKENGRRMPHAENGTAKRKGKSAARSLKRSMGMNERHRASSSVQRFVLPSEQSQIPFEPSRTSNVSLVTYLHMEDPKRYPRKDTNLFDQAINRMFGCVASSRSPWIHSKNNRSLLGIPIMRPDSLVVHAWTLVITLVDLTYTAFLVPLSIAFDMTKQGTHMSWLTITDIVGTTFYFVDMIMEFHTGFIAAYDIRRQLVMRRGFVAENYIRRGGFIVDAICILSLVPELAGALIPNASGETFKILFFFRLLRLLRVARLLAGSSGVHFLVSPISGPILRVMNTATFFLLNVLFTMLVFINLLGCIWWFVAEIEGVDNPNTWVASAGVSFNVANASTAAQYVTSVYFAMTVITTVGFGDITPQTVAEMLVAMLFMGIGLFYFGYIVAAVSNLVSMMNASARGTQIVREKLEEVDVWASARHIPRRLRQEVKTYYLEVWAPHCGARLDDVTKFQELPAALRAELVLSLSGEALRQSYMLSALDMDLMEFLATLGLPFPLIAGHDLYTEGEPADRFWVLQEGELTVMRGITKIGTIVGPAVIGQAAIFSKLLDDCQNRMHTMRAEVNCTLWEFSGGTFSHMLRYRPKVLVRLCLRYRDHLMHLQRKFGKRAPRRIHRMIDDLGMIAHAITNDEPFVGADGVELHIRDPDAEDENDIGNNNDDNEDNTEFHERTYNRENSVVSNRSLASNLTEEGDTRRVDDSPDDDGGSPLREDTRSFTSSIRTSRRELEKMPSMIAAARRFAGEPDWDDWDDERGFSESGSPMSPGGGLPLSPEGEGFGGPLERIEMGGMTMTRERTGSVLTPIDERLFDLPAPSESGLIAFNPEHQHTQYDI